MTESLVPPVLPCESSTGRRGISKGKVCPLAKLSDMNRIVLAIALAGLIAVALLGLEERGWKMVAAAAIGGVAGPVLILFSGGHQQQSPHVVFGLLQLLQSDGQAVLVG